MLKVTILFGHPASPEDFERYYADTHLPLANEVRGADRVELTKFVFGPDGGQPAFYRMAEIYFSTEAQMQAVFSSPECVATLADLNNFATGGVTTIVGTVQA